MKRVLLIIFLIVILFTSCSKENENQKKDEPVMFEDTPESIILENETTQNNIGYLIDFNKLEETFGKLEPKLELLGFSSCNFTSEYDVEYIIFYNDINSRYSYAAPLHIDKVLVIFVSDGVICEEIDTELWSLGYDKKFIDLILKDSNEYGDWTGFCYLHDYDDDGLDELYFYGLSGMSFDLMIYKFKENEFKLLEYIDYLKKL